VAPDQILSPVDGLALRPLPDGRVFLASGGRSIALGGVEPEDLRFVLSHLDGRRTVEEVLAEVADTAEAREAVSNLLVILAERGFVVPVGGPSGRLETPRRAERLTVEEPAGRPSRPATVGIVGGGTAGYLTALALRRAHPEVAVTLIESPDVPIIGVGEATTPLLPQFLHADLGLDVHRLVEEVCPTLKLGIRFEWGTGDGFFYPFGTLDLLAPVVYDGSPDGGSLAALLMAEGALPLVPEGHGVRSGLGTEVAYHLDNRRFAAYLARRAAEAGVEHVSATVDRVELAADRGTEGATRPDVAALHTPDGRRLSYDLYVDCSGFRSLLMGEALGSPFVSHERSLFTDGAVVGAAPHDGPLLPHTVATTREAGWSWRIPQPEGDHLGSVFSSAFTTAERAEEELRAAPGGLGASLGQVRVLRFRPGRRRHFWTGNVVALGNAYGFVEPLESTALHLLIRQILLLVDFLPLPEDPGVHAERQARLDRLVADHWDYVAWFLALHFKFNRRLDTPFWRACREEVDVSRHAELIEAFRERGPLSVRAEGANGSPGAETEFRYPDPLWGPEGIDTLLLGQGVPCPLPEPAEPRKAYRERLGRLRSLARQALPAGEGLRLLAERPELLEAFAESFRRRGPASAALRTRSTARGNSRPPIA